MDKIPLRERLRQEARPIYDALDDGVKMMYCSEQCSMCGAHLTVRQLNRIIIEGVPPICLKHYKEMKGQMAELSQLFNQLSLL